MNIIMIPTIIPSAFNFEQIIEYVYLENHSNVGNFTNFVSFKSLLKSLKFSVKKLSNNLYLSGKPVKKNY